MELSSVYHGAMMNKTKFLVVEDETIVALEIKSALTKMGYKVTASVTNYDDAILSVRQELPDMIIMDINLHNSKDGIETAKYIHKNILYIPIIYLTAYSDDLTLARAAFTNPVGYLLKPFKREELKTTIVISLYKIQNTNNTTVFLSNHFLGLGKDFYFDEINCELYYKEKSMELGKKEKILLNLLVRSRGHIIPFDVIEYEIWGKDPMSSSAIRTLMYRLRTKLNHNFIQTFPSKGVCFSSEN